MNNIIVLLIIIVILLLQNKNQQGGFDKLNSSIKDIYHFFLNNRHGIPVEDLNKFMKLVEQSVINAKNDERHILTNNYRIIIIEDPDNSFSRDVFAVENVSNLYNILPYYREDNLNVNIIWLTTINLDNLIREEFEITRNLWVTHTIRSDEHLIAVPGMKYKIYK